MNRQLEKALQKVQNWPEHHEFRNGYWDTDDILEYIKTTVTEALTPERKP